MNNLTFGKLDAYEKAYVLWLGAGSFLLSIFGIIGYWPPARWVWGFVIFGFLLVGESQHKDIRDFKRKIQKLEERIAELETRRS
jgi:hypothetical protein